MTRPTFYGVVNPAEYLTDLVPTLAEFEQRQQYRPSDCKEKAKPYPFRPLKADRRFVVVRGDWKPLRNKETGQAAVGVKDSPEWKLGLNRLEAPGGQASAAQEPDRSVRRRVRRHRVQRARRGSFHSRGRACRSRRVEPRGRRASWRSGRRVERMVGPARRTGRDARDAIRASHGGDQRRGSGKGVAGASGASREAHGRRASPACVASSNRQRAAKQEVTSVRQNARWHAPMAHGKSRIVRVARNSHRGEPAVRRKSARLFSKLPRHGARRHNTLGDCHEHGN